jgi:hypothetical protein
MTRLRPLMALLLSLLLLGAQQVAFAHMIGHIGSMSGPAAVAVSTAHQGDEGHGEALTLSHVCTTCVSASGLAMAAPCAVPPRLTFDGVFAAPMASPTSVVAAAAPRHYRARAPPAVL